MNNRHEKRGVPDSGGRKLFRRLTSIQSNESGASPSSQSPFWPEEYLADDIPEARIWTYGYNADVIEGLFRPSNQNSISNHGRDLAVRFERDVNNAVGDI